LPYGILYREQKYGGIGITVPPQARAAILPGYREEVKKYRSEK